VLRVRGDSREDEDSWLRAVQELIAPALPQLYGVKTEIFEASDMAVFQHVPPEGGAAGSRVLITSAQDPKIEVREARTGALCHTFTGHVREQEAVMSAVTFEVQPVGGGPPRTLVASVDEEAGALLVWDAATGGVLHSPRPNGARTNKVGCLYTYSHYDAAQGRERPRVVSGAANGSVMEWDGETGERVATLVRALTLGAPKSETIPFAVAGLTLSGGGPHQVVVGYLSGVLLVCEGGTGRQVCSLDGQSAGSVLVGECFEPSWAPGHLHVVSGHMSGAANVWDARAGTVLHRLEAHTDMCKGLVVYQDKHTGAADRIVTGGLDGRLRVWDSKTGESLLTIINPGTPPPKVRTVAAYESGQGWLLVSGSEDGKVRVYTSTGALCHVCDLSIGKVFEVKVLKQVLDDDAEHYTLLAVGGNAYGNFAALDLGEAPPPDGAHLRAANKLG
jgi:WD40 repeat protein